MNILLIPTTNTNFNNVKNSYIYCHNNGHKIYVILDNKYITTNAPTEFIEIKSYFLKLQQLRGQRLNILQKVIMLGYLHIYIKHILKYYSIDVLVVTNDNSVFANVFVNIAKSYKIKTVLHQGNATFKKVGKLFLLEKLSIKLKTRLFKISQNNKNNMASSVDLCLLQGGYWIDYFDNKNYKIVGNSYYRQISELAKSVTKKEIESYKNQITNKQNKQIITFFSQPFYEDNIGNKNNIVHLYQNIRNLQKILEKETNSTVIFKPHPQEMYYKNFSFSNINTTTNSNLLIKSSDIVICVFSTIAVQSKIIGTKTIGFLPPLLDENILFQMRSIFDDYYTDVDALCLAIKNKTLKNNNNDYNDIFNLKINSEETVYQLLNQS